MASQGVATRTTKNEQGAVLGQWTYTTSLPAGETHQLVNSVTDPLGQKTVRYFSVAVDNVYVGWNGCEYGLPLTHNVSTGGSSPLYLSSQTFRSSGALFRSEYVRYERDQTNLCAGGVEDLDRRVAAMRTVYEDDGGTYAETDFSNFDGLGHYRTATTSGSFPAGNARTHVTNFNPSTGTYTVTTTSSGDTVTGGFTPIPPTARWILGSSSYRYDQENGVTGSYVETCYGATTGSLARQRVHQQAGAGQSAVDVVTSYSYDTQGNLTAETSYGGDVQKGIATASICSLNPGAGLPAAPEYEVDYGYQYGVRSSARSLGASFNSLDQQIDPSTGLVRSSTDTTGVLTTTYGYDLMGRVTSVQPAQGARTVYAYTRANPATRALAGVDVQRQGGGGAVLAEQQLVFDALGREYRAAQKLADGSFNVRETLYDTAGNKASVSELQAGNAVQKTSFLSYDPAGRATLIRPADSTTANGFAHDVRVAYSGNRLVTRTVPVGQSLANGAVVESPAVTTELYDRQGRLYQVTEPSGAGGANVTTTYGYDVGNRLSAVATASAGVTQTRTFTYDPRGFLLAETHPEKGVSGNGAVTYSLYDSRGHAGRKVDGPNDLTYQYDGAERLTIVRASGTPFSACNQLSGPRCLKSFTYAIQNGSGDYKNGKLFQSIRYNYPILGGTPYQAFITETYHYGGVDGRVSQCDMQLTFALNGQPPAPSESFTESFAYDLLGNTGSIAYPSCTFSACAGKDVPRTVSFGHTNGFLTAVTGMATTLGGMPSASTYASAITYWPNLMVAQVTHGNGVVDTQANDPHAMRRPLSIASTLSNGQTTLWKTDGYAYDGAGNITQIGAARFLYDGVSRLTSGSLVLGTLDSGAAASQTYAFDAFGNIQSIGGTTLRNTPTNSATNRLSGAASYDAAGNLTAWNGAIYEYDALNQMKHYISGSEEWLYMYDADDERLWSYKPGVPGISSRFDRWTIRDLAGKVLRTYEASGYNWTGSDVEDSIYRDGLLLAAELPNTGATHHFHLDHLGTPRLVTDQNRAQVAYHVYYPFGEEATTFNQDSERMKFTGHERDLASAVGAGDDLDYMHARHESPVTGRFLSMDPIGGGTRHPQSWNRYSYVLGNPMRYTDPWGLCQNSYNGIHIDDCITVTATGDGSSGLFWSLYFKTFTAFYRQIESNIRAFATPRGSLFNGMSVGAMVVSGGLVGAGEDVEGAGTVEEEAAAEEASVTAGQLGITEADVELGSVSSVEGPALRPDVTMSGGRGGSGVKNLTGPPNSAVRGSEGRVFVTNNQGQVVADITKQRVKSVYPGVGFGDKRPPTQDELRMLEQIWRH
jgi:RHS repeat-associated protein